MLMKGEKYGWLSNMYRCEILWKGRVYKSAETIYQMMKCMYMEDHKKFDDLNGFEAKKLGRHVKIRDDWHEVKIDVMRDVLRAKFNAGEILRRKLIELDEPIVEDNYWNDTFWGVCRGRGKNMLGKLLTELREKLIEGERDV